MDQTIEDQLFDAVLRNDILTVRKNLRKDVNINTVCSSGLTPLGAAAHMGNITICETLIENYKRSMKDEDFSSHKNKKLCIDLNDRQVLPKDHKNVGYFVVKKDLDNVDSGETVEIGDGPTPEGMEGLEWDVEIKDTDDTSTDSYSCLYRWYADILNRTSDLLKTPLHCDINQIDRYGRTALHYASDRGHCSIVQLLLSAGCNVNYTASDNISALHLASSGGHCDIVKLLIQAGARVNHITNTKTTALHCASAQGHIKIMQLLLQAGANVDALDASDRTPLVRAASQQQSIAVELLVRHGARINIEDSNGYTPLCEAVWGNSLPIFQTLISAGAKVTQSHYLLHYSVLNNQLDIAKLLITAGSVVNLRDDNGNTPLILAAKNGQVDIARFLLEHGAMANLPNTVTCLRPLHEAVENISDSDCDKFQCILDLLFSHGAELEIYNFWNTPLFRAIFLKKTQIASLLIRYGADVNYCDLATQVDNMCVAERNNNITLVKLLIYAGYDLRNLPELKSLTQPVDKIENVTDWLLYRKFNPMSLMDLCRIQIRKRLGRRVYFKINELGLPRQLSSFLHLEFIQ